MAPWEWMAVRRRRALLAAFLVVVIAAAALPALRGSSAPAPFLAPFGTGEDGAYDPYAYVATRR
ncbi:MAG: hypothetical protein QOG68_2623, partial [Solirubrobacteraceae bacterium]|nr:hypothetical protein [Solirubrobacteraceae bacterium]